jgi:hypothetical protein
MTGGGRERGSAEWQRFRFWRRLYWLMFFASPLWVMAVGIPGQYFFRSDLPAFGAFVVFLAAWSYVAFQVIDFPCPRCGRPFFRGAFFHNSFGRKCVHCGLPKWCE